MLCKIKTLSNYTRVFAGLMAALALCLGLATLPGCGNQEDSAEVIRQSLSQELDSIKSLDETFVNEFSESINMSQLSMYGIDGVEFMKAYLEGFDYKIDDITVDGDTAQATITLTCKSYTGYKDALNAAVDEIIANSDELAGVSNDDINKRVGEIVVSSLNNVELKPTQPITITYTKVDDTWEPASSTSGDISRALMTN